MSCQQVLAATSRSPSSGNPSPESTAGYRAIARHRPSTAACAGDRGEICISISASRAGVRFVSLACHAPLPRSAAATPASPRSTAQPLGHLPLRQNWWPSLLAVRAYASRASIEYGHFVSASTDAGSTIRADGHPRPTLDSRITAGAGNGLWSGCLRQHAATKARQ